MVPSLHEPESMERDRHTMSTQYSCPCGNCQSSPWIHQIRALRVSPMQAAAFTCHRQGSSKEHVADSGHHPKNMFQKVFHISSKLGYTDKQDCLKQI